MSGKSNNSKRPQSAHKKNLRAANKLRNEKIARTSPFPVKSQKALRNFLKHNIPRAFRNDPTIFPGSATDEGQNVADQRGKFNGLTRVSPKRHKTTSKMSGFYNGPARPKHSSRSLSYGTSE